MLYAYKLKKVDEEYRDHKMAFLGQLVKSTTGSGKNVKPKFEKLSDLYDYEKALEEIENPKKIRMVQNQMNVLAKISAENNAEGGGK